MNGWTHAPADLITDVLDLAGAVAVAGLARPDPELPGELRELSGRADAMALRGGAERLEAFAKALDRVADGHRREDVREAIDAWQRLVAWARVMRVELELIRVESATRGGA